jgi:uncharacterized coiled-coil protein SlyX
MAKKSPITDSTQEMKDFNKEAASLVTVLQDLATALNKNAKQAAKFTQESVSAYTESTKEAEDLARKLQGYNLNQLKTRNSEKAFNKDLAKFQQNYAQVAARISILEEKRLTASAKEQVYIDNALKILTETTKTMDKAADHADKLSDRFKDINSQTKVFDSLADFFKDIPVVSKILGDFQKAADKSRDAAVDGGNAFLAGAKELGKFAVKGLGALGASFAVKGVKDIDEKITSLSRNLNISRGEADNLAKSFNSVARDIKGITGKDLSNATQAFAKTLGTTAVISKDAAEEFATQTKFLGLSVEEASKLATLTTATNKNAKEFGNQIRGEVIASNALNNTALDYKDITKDIANSNASIQISIVGQGKSLGQAAIEAKKLGLNLNAVDQIAGSLLNFEQSISAELEAELLTGKNINLEKARLFALNNDTAGVAREIAAQGITTAKFAGMNRIQQEAIAKSIGMSREDLAKSLLEQQALTNLGAKDKTELDKKVLLRVKEVNAIKDATAREEARAQLIKDLGSDELVRQQENRNLTELQADAAQKIVEAFDKLSPLLNIISKVFGFIEKNVQLIALGLTAMASLTIFNKFKSLKNDSANIADNLSNSSQFAGGSFSAGKRKLAKGKGKFGKGVGIAGLAGGLGLDIAAGAAEESGNTGLAKGLNVGSAALTGASIGSMIAPGIGTAIGAALGAGYGLYEAMQPKGPEFANGGIVLDKVTNATVGEAGPEAIVPLDKFNAFIDNMLKSNNELISAVKQGGNVYIDSRMAGTANTLNTYKV